MHYAEIYSEIKDSKKGNVLAKIINFDNVHLDLLNISTYYDEHKGMLVTKIKSADLKTLNSTIHDLIKTQILAEKILKI